MHVCMHALYIIFTCVSAWACGACVSIRPIGELVSNGIRELEPGPSGKAASEAEILYDSGVTEGKCG